MKKSLKYGNSAITAVTAAPIRTAGSVALRASRIRAANQDRDKNAFKTSCRDRVNPTINGIELSLFFSRACVGDFHGFLFLTAMGFVPLHQHVIFVRHF